MLVAPRKGMQFNQNTVHCLPSSDTIIVSLALRRLLWGVVTLCLFYCYNFWVRSRARMCLSKRDRGREREGERERTISWIPTSCQLCWGHLKTNHTFKILLYKPSSLHFRYTSHFITSKRLVYVSVSKHKTVSNKESQVKTVNKREKDRQRDRQRQRQREYEKNLSRKT